MSQQQIISTQNKASQGQSAELSKIEEWRSAIGALLTRWQIPEEFIIVGTALLVGLGTGLGAVAFIWLLGQINSLTLWGESILGVFVGRVLFMAAAGVLVGLMIARWASEAKGHGVPEVMEAVAIRGGRIRPRVAAVKVLASSLTIGTGGSAGREGPIVQVGSALGSTLGQVLGFSEERVRTLVACGAAAGIAATFNAPIAGTIFALEVIIGSFTIRYFGAVVISSVTAAVVSRSALGNQPAFTVPSYELVHLGELPIYIVLGVLAALVAVAFIRVLYFAEHVFDHWQVPMSVKTTIGMVLTALVAFLMPERNVLGPGLHAIGEAIADNFHLSIGLMFSLLILKLLATTFTLGSGNSGGVFAPGLFMGAVLGGIVGTGAHWLWPTVAVNPGAYAIVGMAAVFSGAARAPITAILIVFEMSNDYKLILPLMLATVLATLLAELLFRESIYTLKLRLKGITLQRGRDIDVLESLRVSEVMVAKMETVRMDTTLVEASDLFAETHSHGFPVLDENGALWGIVTVSDLDRVVADELPRSTPVSEFATPRSRLLTATPEESVSEALTRMGTRGIGRLPVVAADNPARLEGWIRRDDIIRAYNMAITRRAELQHRTKRMQLRNLDNTEFVEIELKAGDQAIDKTILDVAPKLPKECILVSIRRNGKMMIPHGDTRLQAGDRITAFVAVRDAEEVQSCLRSKINQ
ncbi:MAG: chloride channel protein [Caldilineaceae bacterium]|nr:chloride channel protein [Caldilineaceae bacterium]